MDPKQAALHASLLESGLSCPSTLVAPHLVLIFTRSREKLLITLPAMAADI